MHYDGMDSSGDCNHLMRRPLGICCSKSCGSIFYWRGEVYIFSKQGYGCSADNTADLCFNVKPSVLNNKMGAPNKQTVIQLPQRFRPCLKRDMGEGFPILGCFRVWIGG